MNHIQKSDYDVKLLSIIFEAKTFSIIWTYYVIL